jgi:hypothetical protein
MVAESRQLQRNVKNQGHTLSIDRNLYADAACHQHCQQRNEGEQDELD